MPSSTNETSGYRNELEDKNPTTRSENLWPGYRFSRTHSFDLAQASAFAYAVGDDNPIHHDPHAAAETRFGRPIVSGTHTTALLLGLVASHFSKFCNVVGVKFTIELQRPVFSDEQVKLEWEINGMEPHPKNGEYVDLTGSVTGSDGGSRVRSQGRILIW